MNYNDSIRERDGFSRRDAREGEIGGTLDGASQTVKIANSLGLHMRPVAQFVDVANQFQSRVWVKKADRVVDGKNPMELILLEATHKTELEICAEGPDAESAVEALIALIESKFGEE